VVAAPPVVAIVGPTASGKSALALAVARDRRGEIVSCDSLQVYRGLDVGSAKATADERAMVPHHLLDVVEPDQDFSAADYARRARTAMSSERTVTPSASWSIRRTGCDRCSESPISAAIGA